MVFFPFRQGFIAKLKSIVGENVVDAIRVKGDDHLEKSRSDVFVLPLAGHDESQLGDSGHGGIDVVPLSVDLRSVQEIKVQVAKAVLPKPPDLPLGIDQFIRQSTQAVSDQHPVDLHRVQIGDVAFQSEEDILNGFLELFSFKEDLFDMFLGYLRA